MNEHVHDWWDESFGFFGKFYMCGDNSLCGYSCTKPQSLTERTLDEVNGLINLLEIAPPCKVLDVPCGYGRHSIELARKGFNVVGVDINNTHLHHANTQATHLQSVVFQNINMLSLEFKNEFDAVVNMFYSFGFFKNEEDNVLSLQNFYNALKPNCKFLMHTDVNIPRILSGNYLTHETRRLEDGNTLIVNEHFDESTLRINGAWTIVDCKSNSSHTKSYSVRVYHVHEFVNMCLDVGFKDCICFGGWCGEPYTSESEDIIFIATK